MSRNKSVRHVAESESLSQTVVEAVADVNDVDPVDLDEQLFDCVDPDALDTLFDPVGPDVSDRDGMIIFNMAGCLVEVESSRTVVVRQSQDEASSAVEAQT